MKAEAFHFGALLFIKGDSLNLDEISRTLGLTPTNTSRKGERYGHAKKLCDFDGWFFSPKVENTQPLDEHIRALWEAVHPHIGYLRDLQKKSEVSVSIHTNGSSLWFGKEYHTFFEIDHRGMKLFTELGIPCKVHVTIKERDKDSN